MSARFVAVPSHYTVVQRALRSYVCGLSSWFIFLCARTAAFQARAFMQQHPCEWSWEGHYGRHLLWSSRTRLGGGGGRCRGCDFFARFPFVLAGLGALHPRCVRFSRALFDSGLRASAIRRIVKASAAQVRSRLASALSAAQPTHGASRLVHRNELVRVLCAAPSRVTHPGLPPPPLVGV